MWTSRTEETLFLQLTFFKEADVYSGLGAGKTTKTFWINPVYIVSMVEYEDQGCTKICLSNGKEYVVVEKPEEIFEYINE